MSDRASISNIVKLSIPIFFANLVIPLVAIVDTGLKGNMDNASYLTATSIATSVFYLIFCSFGFLLMGTRQIFISLCVVRRIRMRWVVWTRKWPRLLSPRVPPGLMWWGAFLYGGKHRITVRYNMKMFEYRKKTNWDALEPGIKQRRIV